MLAAVLVGNELRLRSGLDSARRELARLAAEQHQVEAHVEQTLAHNRRVEALQQPLAQLGDTDQRTLREDITADQIDRLEQQLAQRNRDIDRLNALTRGNPLDRKPENK